VSGHRETGRKRIVVGVDDSPSSKAALLWAMRQAELTGAAVEAVMAWHYPMTLNRAAWAVITPDDVAKIGALFARQLSGAIAEAAAPHSQVQVSAAVRQGNAAQVLLDAADGADLLVVGSRGHGGFAGALLGSVSQHCVHHASCPVVVVRDRAAKTS
jgi:nucleotide-binding universal stress UspA family protein